MKRLFDFVYSNFMTLWNRVVANLRELSTLQQVALALITVALIFIAIMLLIYIIRITKYRTINKIQNVDVVFFNSVWEFAPYKKAKEGKMLFILIIPFTFLINLVVKTFMFKQFSAINSSDYITRRMLENMQLENMRLKDKNKELLKIIDEAPKHPRPAPKVTPKKVEPKVVKEEIEPVKKEEPKKEEPKKEEPKKEAAPKKETEETVTTSTVVADDDKEPEVIMASVKVEEPEEQESEIIDAEIIDPENENIEELMEDVKVKETRGKA
jgi:hypothetical protein